MPPVKLISLQEFVSTLIPSLFDKKAGATRRAFAPFFSRAILRNLRRLSTLTDTKKVLVWWASKRGFRIRGLNRNQIPLDNRPASARKNILPFRPFPVVETALAGH